MAEIKTVTGERYRLAKWEMETLFSYNEEETMGNVTTWQPSLIRKLDALAEMYPDECRAIRKPNSAPQYIIPKKWITIRRPSKRKLTDEQRKELAERMRGTAHSR